MPIRLLLIEDNPGDAVIFREKIGASDLDAALVHVSRLADGLDAIEGGAFDLLLVDLSLPDSHGLESVEKVRKAAPHLPLIVLTGLDDAAVAADAKKRGAVDYLVKWYVDSVSLARYIRYAIEQYRLYGDEMAEGVGPSAPVPSAPASAKRPAPSGDGQEGPAPATADAEAVATRPEADVAEAEVGTDTERGGDVSLLLHAVAAAREHVQEAVRRGQHLEGTLNAALDLFRREDEGGAVHAEPYNLVALAQEAVDDARARAQWMGVPVRVTSAQKKVMASVDRGAMSGYLHRLVALALATTRGDGLAFTLDGDRERVMLIGTWPVRRDIDLTDPDLDPLLALDLALCRRLAARAGGTFTFAAADAQSEATLTLRARSDA